MTTEARIQLTAVMMILLYVGIFTYGVINYHG
jgi:hypothetical protein